MTSSCVLVTEHHHSKKPAYHTQVWDNINKLIVNQDKTVCLFNGAYCKSSPNTINLLPHDMIVCRVCDSYLFTQITYYIKEGNVSHLEINCVITRQTFKSFWCLMHNSLTMLIKFVDAIIAGIHEAK